MNIEKLLDRYADKLRQLYKDLGEANLEKAVELQMQFSYVMSVFHFLAVLKALNAEISMPKESWEKFGITEG